MAVCVLCLHTHAEAKREDAVKQKKVIALRKALSLYSGRLGLEFKQGAGVFVALDARVICAHELHKCRVDQAVKGVAEPL